MKKVISLFLSFILVVTCLFGLNFTAKAETNTISIGDYITFGTYYGKPIVWRCVDIDENGPLMLSDKILCLKAFDAAGDSSDYHKDRWGTIRKKHGSNCWSDSSIRQWLNTFGEVEYTHCPPNKNNVYNGDNPYDNEDGFLTGFSTKEIDNISNTTQRVYLNDMDVDRGYSDGGNKELAYYISSSDTPIDYSQYYYQNVTDKFFLLGPEQTDAACKNLGKDYILNAYPTKSAVENSTYQSDELSADKTWSTFFGIPRTEGASYENLTLSCTLGGKYSMANWNAYNGTVGIRPAFYLGYSNYQEEKAIEGMIGDINLGPYAVKGATVDVAGHEIPLINLEAKIKLGLDSSFKVIDDQDNDKVKVLLGFEQDGSANIQGPLNQGYWSESYREVKSMYQNLTGKKVDTTRLWNKYSSLRGKLKKMKCNLVVDVDSTLIGYLEFDKVNDALVYSEGGVIADFSVSGSMRSYYGPAYVTLGLELGANGKLSFVRENDKINPQININPSFTITAGGGIGTKKTYAEIVAYGTLSADISSTNLKTPFTASVDLGAKWGGYILGNKIDKISGEKSFASMQLYPDFGSKPKKIRIAQKSSVKSKKGYENLVNSASSIDRGYLNEAQAYSVQSQISMQTDTNDDTNQEVSSTGISRFEKNNAFPLNQPSLVNFKDDTALLVWLDDNGEKSDVNKSSLYYSYYDGEIWSSPQMIYENGTNNDMPSVYSDGENAYIVWQKASKVFEDNTASSEMIKYYDLYEVTFTSSSQTFSDPICINKNENTNFEFNPLVYGDDGSFEISWIENSDNNVYQESGENKLFYAKYDSTGVQSSINEVTTTSDCITKVEIGYGYLYYTVQNNENNILYQYYNRTNKTVSSGVVDFSCINKNVYYINSEGVLKRYYTLFNRWFNGTCSGMNGLQNIAIVKSINGLYTYLFTTKINQDFTQDLYFSKKDSNSWSPLQKYSEGSMYIRNYMPIIQSDGTPYVVYNNIDLSSDSNYEKSTLLVDGKTDMIDTQLNYVDFDDEQLNSNTVDLNCEIQNNSSVKLEKVEYTVYGSKDNVISSGDLDCSIDAFSSVQTNININTPGNKDEKLKVVIVPKDYDDYNLDNNAVETTFECAHSYDENIILPTCENAGKEVYTCKYCGYSYEVNLAKLDASALQAALSKAKGIISSKSDYSTFADEVELLYSAYNVDYKNFHLQEEIDNATAHLITLMNMAESFKIKTVSLSLQSSITMNFKVLKSALSGIENPYITFTCGNKTITADTYTEQGDYYIYSYTGISPQLMNDNVSAVLHGEYNGKEYTSPAKTMSVSEYAYTMLERYNSDSYAKLRTLLVNLLDYGSAAQEYIGYQTENLANIRLTDTQKSWATSENNFNNIRDYNYKTIDSPTVSWQSCGLQLNNSVTIKAKFSADDIENKKVIITCGKAEFTYNKDDFVKDTDNNYYVYCDEIFANEMSEELFFTVYDNGIQCSNTMRFSVESYAKLVQNNYAGTKLEKLTTAMMRYGNSAKAYGS